MLRLEATVSQTCPKHLPSSVCMPFRLYTTTACAGIPDWPEVFLEDATGKVSEPIPIGTRKRPLQSVRWLQDVGASLLSDR